MFALKEITILGLVLICTLGYASSVDFSDEDFVYDNVMSYSSGTKRTVTVYKPKLVLEKTTKKRRPVGPRVPGHGGKIAWKSRKHSRGGSKGASGPPLVTGDALISAEKRPIGGVASLPYMPDWSGYRPMPQKPRETLKFIEQTKTYNKRKTPSGKFLEALNAIQRGTAEARAAQKWTKDKQPAISLNKTKEDLKLAVEYGRFQYAREKLGRALYHIKHTIINPGPIKPSIDQASSYMDDLKNSLGSERFDEFLAVMGDVTLMFAIDTTGSMSDDIDAAKRIAVDVINYPRENPVSYILSPFNDPRTGPVIFKNSSEGAYFVEAISRLTATGGGDCPELAFKGILDALYEGPEWGSPLYVITDASAKDDSQTNIEEAKELAKTKGITVNFFTTGDDCGNRDYHPFQEVADATSGQVLDLLNHQELRQLTGFTGSVLGGSNIICTADYSLYQNVTEKRYNITVDDSIDTMSVSVTTKRRNQGRAILLQDPDGQTITKGKLSMSKVSVYEIKKPKVGTWSLVVPQRVGRYNFFVKSSSGSNGSIDFEHYFMQSMPGPITDVPVSDPLIGQQTKVILTLAGYDKVQKNTTVLELITKHGEHIRDVALKPDRRGMRYVASLNPPSQPFKLKIKGTTKAGNSFERVSRNVIEPKHVLLRVVRSDKDFTLRRGERSEVEFYVFNSGANEALRLSVKDRLNYVTGISLTSSPKGRKTRKAVTLTVKNNKWTFVKLVFNVPSNAKIGATDTAMVSASYNNGRGIVMAPVQLLVVE